MDWEFSSAFSVESLSTQIYAVVAVTRSHVCAEKARRTPAFHKAYPDLPLALKADGVCRNPSTSSFFYWGTVFARNEGLSFCLSWWHWLYSALILKSCWSNRWKGSSPMAILAAVPSGRSLHSLLPKLLRVCRWKSQGSFCYDRSGSCTVCCWRPVVSSGGNSTQRLLEWDPECICYRWTNAVIGAQSKFILHPTAAPLPLTCSLKNYLLSY